MLSSILQTAEDAYYQFPAVPETTSPTDTAVFWIITFFVIICGICFIASAFAIISAEERGVVYRFGKVIREMGPGLNTKIPLIDRVERVNMWITTLTLEDQALITKDSVSITVRAAALYRIIDATTSLVNVEDVQSTTSQLAQATMRRVIGAHDLSQILEHGQTVIDAIKTELEARVSALGLDIDKVELLDITLPAGMQRAMGRVAETRREADAQVIAAQGELEGATLLAQAAEALGDNPNAVRLREFATWREIGADNATMIVVSSGNSAEVAAGNTAAATRGALASAAADATPVADAIDQ
jgi:regulator of protease activity HflC (stomatin/prohibitin superfamily)